LKEDKHLHQSDWPTNLITECDAKNKVGMAVRKLAERQVLPYCDPKDASQALHKPKLIKDHPRA
jgi:hypothetical protein